MTSDPKAKVLSSLQRLCVRKEYCSSDIHSKALKALDGDASAAEEVVEKLLADGFVSDSRYAGAFARDKAHLDGWGPVKISYQLRAKGISSADIEEALASVDSSKAGQKLSSLLKAKARSLGSDPQIRLKLLKFALQRGYGYEETDKEVRAILKS